VREKWARGFGILLGWGVRGKQKNGVRTEQSKKSGKGGTCVHKLRTKICGKPGKKLRDKKIVLCCVKM